MTSPSASMGRGGGVRTSRARAGTNTTAPGYTGQARHSAHRALSTLNGLGERQRHGLTALAWLLAAAVLFACYLHIPRTQPANSDGAANALQAWDMLHGNVLLRNWWLSDVSFYTTELPEYTLVELVRGLNADVVHVAAALTYTPVVLLAAALAKGRATGYETAVRAYRRERTRADLLGPHLVCHGPGNTMLDEGPAERGTGRLRACGTR